MTPAIIEQLRQPQSEFVIATLSASVSHIDQSLLSRDDITVLRSHGGNASATAELTVLLAAVALRRLTRPMTNMGFAVFSPPSAHECESLVGKLWTVLGPGRVSCEVARRLGGLGVIQTIAYYHRDDLEAKRLQLIRDTALSLEQVVVEPQLPEDENELREVMATYRSNGVDLVLTGDFYGALSAADIVSLHVPLADDTIGLIDAAALAQMKSTALLINMARHEVVIEADLCLALSNDDIAGYAADVLPTPAERRSANPFQPSVPIWRRKCWALLSGLEKTTHPNLRGHLTVDLSAALGLLSDGSSPTGCTNVLITPHLGGATRGADELVATEVMQDLYRALNIDPLSSPLGP